MSAETTDSPKTDVTTAALAGRLWRDYLKRYWLPLALALTAMSIYSGAQAGFAFSVDWIFAGLSGEAGGPALTDIIKLAPVFIIGLGVIYATALYASTRLTAHVSLSSLRDLQNDMFENLIALDFAQLRAEVSGQHIARFTNDVTVLRETLTRLANGVRDALTFAGLCAAMLYLDAVLFFVVIVIYGVVGFLVSYLGKVIRTASRKAQEQAGDLTSLVGESIAGARMVKTYQIEPLERARAGDAFDERLHVLKKMANTRAINEPVIFIAGATTIAVIIAIVAMRISSGAMAFSDFAGFLTALVMLSQPARGLAR